MEGFSFPTVSQGFILGVGLNVNGQKADFPESLQETATSLGVLKKKTLPREKFLVPLINGLEHWYAQFQEGQTQRIVNQWKDYSETLGKRVRVFLSRGTVEGWARDVDRDGALVVERPGGQRDIIRSGDVVHLKTGKGN